MARGVAADRDPVAEHALSWGTHRGVPPGQDYAAGLAVELDMPRSPVLIARWGLIWLAGPGDGRPPGPALLCQVVVAAISRMRDSARCLSGSGRIRVRLSRVSQDRALRTWSRYSPAA